MSAAGISDGRLSADLSAALANSFTVRTAPKPDCFLRSVRKMSPVIHELLWGPSEFVATGPLADWNVTGQLHRIKTPTLVTFGRFDEMRPRCVAAVVDNLGGFVRLREMPHSGHCSMIDDPGLMNMEIAKFLNEVEQGSLPSMVKQLTAADAWGVELTTSKGSQGVVEDNGGLGSQTPAPGPTERGLLGVELVGCGLLAVGLCLGVQLSRAWLGNPSRARLDAIAPLLS